MPGERPLAEQIDEDEDDDDDDEFGDIDPEQESVQVGVQRLEAVATTWSKWALITAYAGVYLMAYATSLEGQVTTNLTPYATSAFSAHSSVSTVAVIQSIVLSVVKPPMSKIADVFGRFEGFTISVFLFTIGYVMQAASNNVQTYAASAIFYSAGSTGVQILQQIFIADTSDLLNRALFITLPNIPFLINVWVGPAIANWILRNATWRWGYGIWAIILPLAFLPLALVLHTNQRRAAQKGLLPPRPYAGQSIFKVIRSLWYELDVFGLLLLSAGISLILVPLTLAAGADGGWANKSIIAMFVIGFVLLVLFPFWERSPTYAPHAFFPTRLLMNRTVMAGVAIAFFYFMAFYLSVFPYFFSYLLVVQNQSVTAAGHITQTFTFTSTITSLVLSVLIRYVRRYKIFVIIGSFIYITGLALMIQYRKQDVSTFTLVACQVFLGVGGAMIHLPAQLGIQASANHQEVGSVTAIFLTCLEIGGAVGSAVSGAIWTTGILPRLKDYLPADLQDQAKIVYGSLAAASDYHTYPFGSPGRVAINQAYQETMTRILFVALLVSLPLIPLSLCMENYKLDQMDSGVKGTVIGHSDPEEDDTSGTYAESHSRSNSIDSSRSEFGNGTFASTTRRKHT